MTAVEWLEQELKKLPFVNVIDVFEQAKEMEREQHGKTWDTALDKYEVRAGNYMRAYEDFDDYYAETYGSKGSDGKCPNCGAMEVDAMSPKTIYECGSSDYDQRPNTFKQSEGCKGSDETKTNNI